MPGDTEMTQTNSKYAQPVGETEDEHKKKLEAKGHKEWNLVKNAVKADSKFHHRHKHKIIGGTAVTIIAVVVVVLVVTLAVVAAVVVNRNKTAAQKARDAATATAAVKIGKISVVPPKEGEDSRRRVLGFASHFQVLSDALSSPSVKKSFRGLADADADSVDVSKFAVDSDYKTTTKAEYVEDGLAQQLQTPNMILCMLAQTNADEFMTLAGDRAEPYVANVDENKCNQGGGSGKPQMTPWTVIATQPSTEVCDTDEEGKKVNCANVDAESGLIQVSAWLLIQGGTIELEFKLEVAKSTLVIRDDGSADIHDLQIQFRQVQDPDQGGNGQNIEGVLKYNKVNGKSKFQFYMMGVGIVSEATEDAGWAKVEMQGQQGLQSSEVSWNANALNVNNQACLDREHFVPTGDSYKLFDKNGDSVHVESYIGFSVTPTVDVTVTSTDESNNQVTSTLKAGKKVHGGAGPWGFWMDNWDPGTNEMMFPWHAVREFEKSLFAPGKKVMVEDYSGASASEEHTIQLVKGKMYMERNKKLSLAKLKGATLFYREMGTCPGGTLNHGQTFSGTAKIAVKEDSSSSSGFKLVKVATPSDFFAACDFPWMHVQCYNEYDLMNEENCTEAILSPTWTTVTESEVTIPDGSGNSHWGLEIFSPTFTGRGHIWPLSENPKMDVVIQEGGVLNPTKTGTTKTLVCRWNCVNGSKLNTNDFYYPESGSMTRASFHTYTYNEKTGQLTDENNVEIVHETESIHMRLVEDTAETWTALGCNANVNTDCNWKEPSVGYNWNADEWAKTVSLKRADGSLRTPANPIELDLSLPADFSARTLSTTDYAGKDISFTYENGWIDGLPIACFDRANFAFSEATSKFEYDRFRYTCPGERVPDLILPDGVPVKNTDISGKTTNYVLKATVVRQMLKPHSSQGPCSALNGAPTTATVPTADDIGELNLATKPAESEVIPIKVESGQTKDEYLPTNQ